MYMDSDPQSIPESKRSQWHLFKKPVILISNAGLYMLSLCYLKPQGVGQLVRIDRIDRLTDH